MDANTDGVRDAGSGRCVAALTGDLVGSRDEAASVTEREDRVEHLKETLGTVEALLSDRLVLSFQMFRGDSFQGVVAAEEGLRAALAVRVHLRSQSTARSTASALDARVAIGIGRIDRRRGETVAESDGTALRRSGPLLDSVKNSGDRLRMASPWSEVDAELNTECALLDAIVRRWSKLQAEALLWHLVLGETQKATAARLGVSQSAIAQRIGAADGGAVAGLLTRYRLVVEERLIFRRL